MHELASIALFDEQTRYLNGRVLEARNWTLVSASYPRLEVLFEGDGRVPMRVRMECQDWNDVPPSVILLDSAGVQLQAHHAPTGSSIFNQSPHDITRLPFVCMAGTREYHTHSSHVADLWSNYKSRAGYDLGGIITQIWNGWRNSKP